MITSRLAVDNFTGRTVEAIKQDFFSTLFVSGLETILSAEVNAELAAKKHATSTAREPSYLLP